MTCRATGRRRSSWRSRAPASVANNTDVRRDDGHPHLQHLRRQGLQQQDRRLLDLRHQARPGLSTAVRPVRCRGARPASADPGPHGHLDHEERDDRQQRLRQQQPPWRLPVLRARRRDQPVGRLHEHHHRRQPLRQADQQASDASRRWWRGARATTTRWSATRRPPSSRRRTRAGRTHRLLTATGSRTWARTSASTPRLRKALPSDVASAAGLTAGSTSFGTY